MNFPRLERHLFEPFVVAVLSAMAGIIFAHAAWWMGLLAALPCILFGLNVTRVEFQNKARSRNWARTFSRTISPGELEKQVATAPSRYILHACFYGGFDTVGFRTTAEALAVLEERDSGSLAVIHPATRSVIERCEAMGVEVARHTKDGPLQVLAAAHST